MGNHNLVAARLGLPFVCCRCSRFHKKADLNDPKVKDCFNYICEIARKNLPQSEIPMYQTFPWPTLEIYISNYFHNVPLIRYSYPIEDQVSMLALPNIGKVVQELDRKLRKWEHECLLDWITRVENEGKLFDVHIESNRLFINGTEATSDYPLAFLMLKCRKTASALSMFFTDKCWPKILDVEWKSIEKPAEILVEEDFLGKKLAIFFSKRTGMLSVPNSISSIEEAKQFIEN